MTYAAKHGRNVCGVRDAGRDDDFRQAANPPGLTELQRNMMSLFSSGRRVVLVVLVAVDVAAM